MDIEEKQRIREAVLRVFRSKTERVRAPSSCSKIPEQKKTAVKPGGETLKTFKLYVNQNKIELPLIGSTPERKGKYDRLAPAPREETKVKRKLNETHRHKRKRESSYRNYRSSPGHNLHSKAACHCSKTKEKRRKSRSERNKQRSHQQEVSHHERSEFKKHIKKAQEITQKPKDDGHPVSLITHQRLTRHIGLYNQGKKSSSILRDPLVVPPSIEQKTQDTIEKMVHSKSSCILPSENDSMPLSGGHMTLQSTPPQQITKGLPTLFYSRSLDFDRALHEHSIRHQFLGKNRGRYIPDRHSPSYYSPTGSKERHSQEKKKTKSISLPEEPPLKEISQKIQNGIDLGRLFPGEDYKQEVIDILLKTIRLNNEIGSQSSSHIARSGNQSEARTRSVGSISSSIRRNLEKDFQKYSSEKENAVLKQSKSSEIEPNHPKSCDQAQISQIFKANSEKNINTNAHLLHVSPHTDEVSRARKSFDDHVTVLHDTSSIFDDLPNDHHTISSSRLTSSNFYPTPSMEKNVPPQNECLQEGNNNLCIFRQKGLSHDHNHRSHGQKYESHAAQISYVTGFDEQRPDFHLDFKFSTSSSQTLPDDNQQSFQKSLHSVTDGVEYLRQVEVLDEIWSARNSATESQEGVWHGPGEEYQEGRKKQSSRENFQSAHSTSGAPPPYSISKIDGQHSMFSPSLPISGYPDSQQPGGYPDSQRPQGYLKESLSHYHTQPSQKRKKLHNLPKESHLLPYGKIKLSWHSSSDESSPCWHPTLDGPQQCHKGPHQCGVGPQKYEVGPHWYGVGSPQYSVGPEVKMPESPSPTFKMYPQKMF